jgi:hypothetical protein
VEFLAKYVEGGKASHPSAADFVHYGNLTVIGGIVTILGYQLLNGLFKDGN